MIFALQSNVYFGQASLTYSEAVHQHNQLMKLAWSSNVLLVKLVKRPSKNSLKLQELANFVQEQNVPTSPSLSCVCVCVNKIVRIYAFMCIIQQGSLLIKSNSKDMYNVTKNFYLK